MANFSKGFTFGVLTGALLGAATALLLAPGSGSDLRNKLSYRIQTYIDELRGLIDELSDEDFVISDAKKQGDEVVEEAQKRAEDLINEAEDLLKSISDSTN